MSQMKAYNLLNDRNSDLNLFCYRQIGLNTGNISLIYNVIFDAIINLYTVSCKSVIFFFFFKILIEC